MGTQCVVALTTRVNQMPPTVRRTTGFRFSFVILLSFWACSQRQLNVALLDCHDRPPKTKTSTDNGNEARTSHSATATSEATASAQRVLNSHVLPK